MLMLAKDDVKLSAKTPHTAEKPLEFQVLALQQMLELGV